MATLPKHLRPRWRYLAVEIESWAFEELSERQFQQALWDRARGLFGDVGSAGIGLDVVRFTYTAGRGQAIVRIYRGTEDRARAVFATVTTVAGVDLSVLICGVSGTIRACEENYLGAAAEPVRHEIGTLNDLEGTAAIRTETVDLATDSRYVGATIADLT